MTDPLGQSQVLPYLLGLANFKIEIHLISFEKQEKFNAKKEIIEGLIQNKSVIWYPLTYHQKPPVLSTIFDLWQLNKKANAIIEKHSIGLVHCRSYISSLVGLALKRKKGIPFIFDMRGFWADERIDGNIWKLSNPIFRLIYNFFKKKEKAFITESDYVVSLTENAKNEIQSWNLNKKNIQIQVIPCCADLTHFSVNRINDGAMQEWQSKTGLSSDDFVISYIGSLGTWYMIDEMMEFMKVAQEKINSCKFLIITADSADIAFNAAKKVNIPLSSIIVRKAERSEVPFLIALSKFSVFFIKPSYSKKASSPTKLAEILGMGVPVVCNANVGDVESIVNTGHVGYVLKDFSRIQYELAIKQMLELLPVDKIQISDYANKYASLNDGVSKYHFVYNQVLKTIDGGMTHP